MRTRAESRGLYLFPLLFSPGVLPRSVSAELGKKSPRSLGKKVCSFWVLTLWKCIYCCCCCCFFARTTNTTTTKTQHKRHAFSAAAVSSVYSTFLELLSFSRAGGCGEVRGRRKKRENWEKEKNRGYIIRSFVFVVLWAFLSCEETKQSTQSSSSSEEERSRRSFSLSLSSAPNSSHLASFVHLPPNLQFSSHRPPLPLPLP